MKQKVLDFMQKVVRLGLNMWRSPYVDPNNLTWFYNLQQQQLQTFSLPSQPNLGHVNVAQESGQSYFPHSAQAELNTTAIQPVYEAISSEPYGFYYTNGEQAARFYEQFYRNCTGRKTPEVAPSRELVSDTNLIVDNSVNIVQTFTENSVTKGEGLSQANSSCSSNFDVASMNRGSKRNRNDSDRHPDVNCKKGVRSLTENAKTNEVVVDDDIILCNLERPPATLIDLTGSATESPSAGPVKAEKDETTSGRRKFYVTPYGRELKKHRSHSKHSSVTFTVATYNVLSQSLLLDNRYLYRQCDQESLTWESRRNLILDQISQNHPDVLCLQEIEESHFHSFFLPELTKKGYEAIYKKRTGNKPDGCAVCYKSSLFTMETSVKVEYFKKGVIYLDRDNVGLILLLSLKKSPKTKICIATTHLLFNPRRGDVKLAQLQLLLTEIDKIASRKEAVKPWKSAYHPIIFCGDLNMEPYSDLYEFIVRGSLVYQGLLCRDLSGQEEGGSGSNKAMSSYILPEELGISDQCQYEEIFKDRLAKYKVSCTKKTVKKRTETSKADDADVIIVEDGEIIDGEEAGQSCNDSSVRPGSKCMIAEAADCVLLNTTTTNTSDIFDTSASSSAVDMVIEEGECVDSDNCKSPNSYSELREMSKQSKAQIAACAQAMQSSQSLEESVLKHCSHNKGKLSHQMNFVSVYSHQYRNRDKKWTKEVTTNHGRTNCTVDYIFYTVDDKQVEFSRRGAINTTKVKEGKLKLLEKLDLFVDDELEDLGGLPNEHEGSDHIMLFAKFQLRFK